MTPLMVGLERISSPKHLYIIYGDILYMEREYLQALDIGCPRDEGDNQFLELTSAEERIGEETMGEAIAEGTGGGGGEPVEEKG
jgi:hypothetical protein